MKVIVDNLNNEAVFIAPEIEYLGNSAVTRDEQGNLILILGDMTPQNSHIECIDQVPDDFYGRNYTFSEGTLIRKV